MSDRARLSTPGRQHSLPSSPTSRRISVEERVPQRRRERRRFPKRLRRRPGRLLSLSSFCLPSGDSRRVHVLHRAMLSVPVKGRSVLLLTSCIVALLAMAVVFPQPSRSELPLDVDCPWWEKSVLFRVMHWMFYGAQEKSDVVLFARHLQRNWRTQPKHRWNWMQRQKQKGVCDGDTSDPQIQAVHGLLLRQFPSFRDRVQFSRVVDCGRATSGTCFSIAVEDDVLCIRGSSGVDLASGLHWFVKEECKGMSTWKKVGGTQFMEGCLSPDHIESLRDSLHLAHERIVPLSLYQNVVTSGYSMAFWDWERWEAEIDWMALHGVNLPLALAGQEYIWVEVYKQLGIDFSELSDFFTGPAFLSWGRMGNIQGYAGPLPWSYIQSQADLQKRIVRRMRDFGMTPVFSGFAGFVPRALLHRRPNLKAKRSYNWCDFPEEYCCMWLLDPSDPLFHTIGSTFVRLQRSEYGFDEVGFYSVDVFNEMVPSQADPAYLRQTSDAVHSALRDGDRSAVWVMQAWLFYSDRNFWKSEQIKAVLSGVPSRGLLLLDLYAERYPQWKRTDAFYGRPFIWCNLHNFGGNVEMHGAMSEIAQGVHDALRARTNVVGVGMCPEGIEQNPVVYELASEMAYRDTIPDLEPWFRSYADQRYGGRDCVHARKAWRMLSQSVYENTARRPETVMDIPVSRPGLAAQEAVWGLKPFVWYNPNKVIEAWDALLKCRNELGSSSSYQFDLADVGRQVLSKLATKHWKMIGEAYREQNARAFQANRKHVRFNRTVALTQAAGERLLELLQDMDALVSTHVGFLMGPVLHEARRSGVTEQEQNLMEKNMKLQLTIWGQSPDGNTELSDYANKEWSGLIHSFYRERHFLSFCIASLCKSMDPFRWRLWIERCLDDIRKRREYDSASFIAEIVAFTHQWIEADNLNSFLIEPRDDAMSLSEKLFAKYRKDAWMPSVLKRVLYVCGNAEHGRLGLGKSSGSELLLRICEGVENVKSVCCGGAHTVVLTECGSVWSFGLNSDGQLGHCSDEEFVPEPAKVDLPEAVEHVSAGHLHTLCLTAAGNVYAFGSNVFGQLGHESTSSRANHVPVRVDDFRGIDICCGASHSLGLTADGEVYAWGSNQHGQLGQRQKLFSSLKQRHPRLLRDLRGVKVQSLAAGHVCSGCVDEDGYVYSWGSNQSWQLGVASDDWICPQPTKVPSLAHARQLLMGGSHAMCLMENESAFVWGTNENGCLGLGPRPTSRIATEGLATELRPESDGLHDASGGGRSVEAIVRQPTLLSGEQIAEGSLGWKHSCGITPGGALMTWGWGGTAGEATHLFENNEGSGGQLGNGDDFDAGFPSTVTVPRVPDGCDVRFSHVSCGLNHTAAVAEIIEGP